MKEKCGLFAAFSTSKTDVIEILSFSEIHGMHVVVD